MSTLNWLNLGATIPIINGEEVIDTVFLANQIHNYGVQENGLVQFSYQLLNIGYKHETNLSIEEFERRIFDAMLIKHGSMTTSLIEHINEPRAILAFRYIHPHIPNVNFAVFTFTPNDILVEYLKISTNNNDEYDQIVDRIIECMSQHPTIKFDPNDLLYKDLRLWIVNKIHNLIFISYGKKEASLELTPGKIIHMNWLDEYHTLNNIVNADTKQVDIPSNLKQKYPDFQTMWDDFNNNHALQTWDVKLESYILLDQNNKCKCGNDFELHADTLSNKTFTIQYPNKHTHVISNDRTLAFAPCCGQYKEMSNFNWVPFNVYQCESCADWTTIINEERNCPSCVINEDDLSVFKAFLRHSFQDNLHKILSTKNEQDETLFQIATSFNCENIIAYLQNISNDTAGDY